MQRVILGCAFSQIFIVFLAIILYVESKFISKDSTSTSENALALDSQKVAALNWSKDRQAQILVDCALPDGSISSKCSIFLMMKDPYLIPWNSRSTMIRRALAQMNAYQELFSAPNEINLGRKRRKRLTTDLLRVMERRSII